MKTSTQTIEKAGQSGLGVIRAQELHGTSDQEFGWQKPQSGKGANARSDGEIEIALPRAESPQGTNNVLVRDSANPDVVLVFSRPRWEQFTTALLTGQYDMTATEDQYRNAGSGESFT